MPAERSPAQESKTRKLARLARPLRPARAPWYVQHAAPGTPLAGWWWQPCDAERPLPLAINYDAAVIAIAAQLDQGVPA